ncbi:MAG: hypothetical protein P1P84_25870, partial [Deferrisomatales bacterium]|nr:hypothetical protein [Deferrisomatales bacterium]
MSLPWCWLHRQVETAEDGVVWLARRVAERCTTPQMLDRSFRDELAPVLASLGPVARGRYAKLLAPVFNVAARDLRGALEADLRPTQTLKGRSSSPPPTDQAADKDSDRCPADGEIVLTKRGTERLRRTRDGEAVVGKVIFTGHLKPLKRVRLSDVGELMVGEIRCPERGIAEQVTLPPDAWEARSRFKGSLPSMDFAWYGTDDELQAFMLHLSREPCPRVRGERVLGIHPLDGGWACVFTDRTVLPDGTSTSELIHFSEGDTGFLWELGEALAAPRREDLQGFSAHILEFNATGKAASIVGWLMALPFKARLSARVTAEFPILFAWGPRGSGKSQYQEQLALRFYSGGQTVPKKLDDLTAFTHLLSASASNLVPWCIDEYKGRGVAMDSRHEVQLSSTLRRAYNQLEGSRGNKDGRTLKRYRAVAPIFLAGEDNITEPAVLERVVEVFLSTASRAGKREHWQALQGVNLEAVGLDYVRWSLTVSDGRMREVFQAAQVDIDRRLADRLRHNAAVMVFGLRMLGLYLEQRDVPIPQLALRAYEEEA